MARAGRWEGPYGIVAKAALLAVPLVAARLAVVLLGGERAVPLTLLTALLGGVIFTLTILLSGVLADFKESERLVSELATTFRRLHADLGVLASGERLASVRRGVAESATAAMQEICRGRGVRTRPILTPLEPIDALVAEVARQPLPAGSAVRTVQVHVGTIVRNVERLEMIVDTTFLRPGYVFAGTTVAAALAALTFADLGASGAALAIHGFASFLLIGLVLLIYDLDNPFQGTVKASVHQLQKAQAALASGAQAVPVVAASR